MAMTKVRKSAGKVTCALGLANPIKAQHKANHKRKGGICLRHGLDIPMAGFIRDKLEKTMTDLTRRRINQT
jgi:hypothetical protein